MGFEFKAQGMFGIPRAGEIDYAGLRDLIFTVRPDCAVIVISGEESKATAVRAADAGALDFIESEGLLDKFEGKV